MKNELLEHLKYHTEHKKDWIFAVKPIELMGDNLLAVRIEWYDKIYFNFITFIKIHPAIGKFINNIIKKNKDIKDVVIGLSNLSIKECIVNSEHHSFKIIIDDYTIEFLTYDK